MNRPTGKKEKGLPIHYSSTRTLPENPDARLETEYSHEHLISIFWTGTSVFFFLKDMAESVSRLYRLIASLSALQELQLLLSSYFWEFLQPYPTERRKRKGK